MTRRVIDESSTGAVVSYEETPAERDARLAEDSAAASQRLSPITPGQKRVLVRVRARSRRG